MLRRSTTIPSSVVTRTSSSSILFAITNNFSSKRFCSASLSAQRDLLRTLVADRREAIATLPPEEVNLLLHRWDERAKQNTSDPLTVVLLLLSAVNMLGVYLIIFDWLYQGHVDLWDGTYGLDDDEDDDEDDD
jgi:hypothetical protein